jgi:hypothetical protein
MSRTVEEIALVVGGAALLLLSGPIGATFWLTASQLLALQTVAITAALAGAIGLLQPSAPVMVQSGTLSVNNPVAYRRVCYGTTGVNAGVPTFAAYPLGNGAFQNSGYDHQWLHLVYTLTSHEITQFKAVIIDGVFYTVGTDLVLSGNYYELTAAAAGSIYYDGSSGYNTGSLIAFEFDEGDPLSSAQPFPGLVAATAHPGSNVNWTSACLQRGCAKVHVALRYCADLTSNPSNLSPAPINPYAGSRLPKLQFLFVGKPIQDTRGSAWMATTHFSQWSHITDVDERVEVVTIAGTTGTFYPLFFDSAPNQGQTTSDGGVTWTNAGPLPSGENWLPSTAFAGASLVIDPNGNLQFLNVPGGITSGLAAPSWATGLGMTTSDGGHFGAWVCLGPVLSTAANPSNPALIVYDYLTDTDYGMGADPATIDLSTVNAAANICDTLVPYEWPDGAAPPLTEPRYSCDGMFDQSSTRGSVLKALCDSMGGFAVPPGDLWRIYAGAYNLPTITLTDADLRDSIKGDFRVSRRDLCNGVKGTFFPAFLPIAANSPEAHLPPQIWQQTDFPPYQGNGLLGHPNYVAEDGMEVIWKDVEFPFTTSLWACQRLAKIILQQIRYQVTLSLSCKLSAYQVQAGDTITFIHERWTGLTPPAPTQFFVQQATLVLDTSHGDTPALGVDLVLRETDSTVYFFGGPLSPGATGEYSTYGSTGIE